MHVKRGKFDHDISHTSPYLESMCSRCLESTMNRHAVRRHASALAGIGVSGKWRPTNTAGKLFCFALARCLSKSACCCGVHACCVSAAWWIGKRRFSVTPQHARPPNNLIPPMKQEKSPIRLSLDLTPPSPPRPSSPP
jgi:hypothetical protein